MSDPTPPTPPPAPKQAQARNWGVFYRGALWMVLLTPAVLATIAPFLYSDYWDGMSHSALAAFLGIPAGIVCGVLLWRVRGEDGALIVLHRVGLIILSRAISRRGRWARIVLLSVGLVILSFTLGLGGCVVALNIR